MTSNFVYTPPTHNNVPIDYHNSPYIGHFYAQPNSPFIPPMMLSGSAHPSPYGTPAAASVPLPPSPHLGPIPPLSYYPAFVAFPSSGDHPSSPYASQWERQRRSSWNGGPQSGQPWVYNAPPVRQRTRSFNDPYANPVRQQTQPFNNPYANPVRQQTQSFSNPYANPPPFSPPAGSPYVQHTFQPTLTVPEPLLHPYLDGSKPRHDIIFDFAASAFRPMRQVGRHIVPLTFDELNQNATHPPMYKIKLTSDYWIPEFPVNMDFRTDDPYKHVPPIKLGDVLSAIYGSLQKGISQYEWAKLSPQHEYLVSQAYTKRCKALGHASLAFQNQGVKGVDFLFGKTRFRGLVRVGETFEEMKLIVD